MQNPAPGNFWRWLSAKLSAVAAVPHNDQILFLKSVGVALLAIGLLIVMVTYFKRNRRSLVDDVGNWFIMLLAIFGLGWLSLWGASSFWAVFVKSSTYTMLFGAYHPWG